LEIFQLAEDAVLDIDAIWLYLLNAKKAWTGDQRYALGLHPLLAR
jgi:hypothetical protein